MKNCSLCEHARQRCKLDDQQVVGCSKVYSQGDKVFHQSDTSVDKEMVFSGAGNVYLGWFFAARRVGDIVENNVVGRGIIVNGVLVDKTQLCAYFKEIA